MAWHHKVQPHHHYSIWGLSVLAVLAAAVMYNTVAVESLRAESEPSEKTKKFFGFDGEGDEGGNWTMPAECKMNENEDKMRQLSDQMNATSQEMATLSHQDQSQMTEEQRQAQQTKISELQAKMQSLQAEMEAMNQSFQAGPSDDCKKAMVGQMVTQMEKMQAKMSGKFFGTLDKVDATVAKVESSLPGLADAGVAQEKIDNLEADVATIKTSVATLRAFFSKIIAEMTSFLAKAKNDPLSTFSDMEKNRGFMNEADAGKAAKAADDMVGAFENMVTILDEIATSQGTE